MTQIQDFAAQITKNVEKVIIGKAEAIELLMVALLCDGHILIEDVPGVGKTMLARALAISLGGQFKRLQCTPDLLPNDVTGVSIFNQQSGQFEFRPGPVFVNILLADEINRATPRTQSALLEAMQEQQVTVDGITHALPRPFLVLATQNPIEYEGTFPLPEAQLDRFLMRLSVGYPAFADEKALLTHLQREHPINTLQPRGGWQTLLHGIPESGLGSTRRRHPAGLHHPADLGHAQSPRPGAGRQPARQPGAVQGLPGAGRLRGRDHVLPDDIKYLLPVTMTHRLIVTSEAELRGHTAAAIVKDLLAITPLELGSLKK